jgi:hypothetical protein
MFVDQGLILPLFPGCNKDESILGKYSPKKQRKATEVKTFGNKTDKAVLR